MKTATGLGLIALGAILAFAVTEQPSFLDLHVAGWVLMLTGGVGVVLPRASHGTLRRRTVWRGERPTQEIEVEETNIAPKFSPLRSRQAHDRSAGSMAPNGMTRQHGEHDRQNQPGGQPLDQ